MSFAIGDAQGYVNRRPLDRSVRSFKACGHSVETRGSDNRFPSHGRLLEFQKAHGNNTCPICLDPQGQEFRQLEVRFIDAQGHQTGRSVNDQRHAENLIRKLFREGQTREAMVFLNGVQVGSSWRAE